MAQKVVSLNKNGMTAVELASKDELVDVLTT
jgi:hypothetical protein